MAAGSGKIQLSDILDDRIQSELKKVGDEILNISVGLESLIRELREAKKAFSGITDGKGLKTASTANTDAVKRYNDAVVKMAAQEKKIQELIARQRQTADDKELNRLIKQEQKEIEIERRKQDKLRSMRQKDIEAAFKDQERVNSKKLADAKKIADALERQKQREVENELRYQQKLARAKVEVSATAPASRERLVAENKVLQIQMQKLNPLITKERDELYRLNIQYKRNTESLNKMNVEKGKTGKALAGFISSVKGLAASYLSLYSIVALVRKIFSDTRELDKIRLTMSSVIKSTTELGQTTKWLGDVSQRFGLDLLNLSERYIKFRAATLQSKVTVQETQAIFESFSKAAGVLGLRTDEVGGVFLALEQMMSKGKVTTEELRRQLGERLPGAFQIMATSLGVATRELDKMLKSGQVMSEEVLPKFAQTMERVYGIENVNRIDTLAAAQGRMNKAWLDFVASLEASSLFKEAIGILTQLMNSASQGTRSLSENVRAQYESADKMFSIMDKMTLDEIARYKMREKAANDLRDETLLQKTAIAIVTDYMNKRITKEAQLAVQTQKRAELASLSEEELADKMKNTIELMDNKGNTIEILSRKRVGAAKENIGWYDKEISKTQEQIVALKDVVFLIDQIQRSRPTEQTFEETVKGLEEQYQAYAKLSSVEAQTGDLVNNKDLRKAILFGKTTYKDWLEWQLAETEKISDRAERIERKRILESALFDISKKDTKGTGGKKGETPLEKARRENDVLIQAERAMQERVLSNRVKYENLSGDEVADIREKNAMEILQLELGNIARLKQFTKEGSIERQEVEMEFSKKITEINANTVDNIIDEKERLLKEEERLAKLRIKQEEQAQAETAVTIEEWMSEQILARQKIATSDVEANKNNTKKVAQIQAAAELDILGIMLRGATMQKNIYEDGSEDYKRWQLEELRIKEQIEKQKQEATTKTAKLSKEQYKQLVQFGADQVNAGFDVIRSFQDNNTAIIDDTYRREMILAGNSVKGKMDAELKYYNAKKKLARKQAALDKAQAVFNIGLSTAMAIMKVWEVWAAVPGLPEIMTAIVAAMGAAQIAAVLAKEVPAYEKGGIVDKSGAVMVGEKGKEMAILPSGQRFLTPETPSILNMPKGTEIIPHDETQKMLANAARNNFINETIDLSATNNYLRSIRDKESVTIAGGYKYVNKNGIKGRYALGV